MTVLKRGVIKAYTAGTHKASVQVAGSLAVWLDAIPVATDIDAAEVIAGRECGVLFFTDDNPDDAVVVTVHGAVPSGKHSDPGGTTRVQLAAATPHVILTGDVKIPATLTVGDIVNPNAKAYTYTGNEELNVKGKAGIMVDMGLGSGIPAAYTVGVQGRAIARDAGTTAAIGLDYMAGQYLQSVANAWCVRAVVLSAGATSLITTAAMFTARNVQLILGGVAPTNLYGFATEPLTIGTNRLPFYDSGVNAAIGDNHGNRFRSNTMFGSLTGAFGGGDGVIGIANRVVVPSTNPALGGVLYAEAGALKWRGSAGTVTIIAAA